MPGSWMRTRLISRFAAALTALLFGCAPVPAESPGSLGSLSGKARLEGVYTDQSSIRLRLDGPRGSFVAGTDAKGNFAFREIPSGRYSLSATRDRYFPAFLSQVEVAPGATVPPLTLRNHRELLALRGHYDAGRLLEAEDPEFGGTVPVQSPFLTNLSLSPDGERLAFILDGAIRSVRLDGSESRIERALPAGLKADWLDWGQSGFLLRSWSGPDEASPSHAITLLAEAGPRSLVAPGPDPLFAPVFSPDERQVAFIRYEPQKKSPLLMRVPAAGGAGVLVLDLLDRLNLRGIWDGSFGLMFAPLAWRPEGLMFHAPMTCQLERTGFTLGKDGLYVLRDPERPETLHKAHFYSYYAHAFSHDGTRMLYAYGPEIRSKSLEDPVVTAPGVTVGHHTDEVLESLIPSPDGERLFYLTPSGIEEMRLLSLNASP